MHWQFCLYCSFGFPQLLADSHPGAQRAPGPYPVPAPGRAKKALKEMIEVCNKSLLGKLSSLSLLPALPVVVELTKSLMALRPLCKVFLPLSQAVVASEFFNFYYYCYFNSVTWSSSGTWMCWSACLGEHHGRGLTGCCLPLWITFQWKFLSWGRYFKEVVVAFKMGRNMEMPGKNPC